MSSTMIIECTRCGQKLGVPHDRGTVHVTCPTCRMAWDWVQDGSTVPPRSTFVDDMPPRGSRVPRKTSSPRPARQRIDIYAPIGSLVVMLACYLGYHWLTFVPPRPLPIREVIPPRPLPVSDAVPPTPLPAREAVVQAPRHPLDDLPPEQKLPQNGDGVFRFDRLEMTSTLRIVPRSEQLHVVVKVENRQDGQLVCWFMIREGQSAETPIPHGSYRLKFAYGKRWYGEQHLFGPDASYSAIVNEISIPSNTVQTLDLTPSATGTLRENKIGSKDF